jgi:hypothetical protein
MGIRASRVEGRAAGVTALRVRTRPVVAGHVPPLTTFVSLVRHRDVVSADNIDPAGRALRGPRYGHRELRISSVSGGDPRRLILTMRNFEPTSWALSLLISDLVPPRLGATSTERCSLVQEGGDEETAKGDRPERERVTS